MAAEDLKFRVPPLHVNSLHRPRPLTLSLQRTAEGLQIVQPPKRVVCELDGCSKTFADAPSLKKHQAKHAEKQFACGELGCGKRFIDNSKLKRHMLVHSGEKPYPCEFCGKRFSLDFNLKTHLRIHTGEKPYQCSYKGCYKRFSQSSNLASHQRTHYSKDDEIRQRMTEEPQPFIVNSPQFLGEIAVCRAVPRSSSEDNIPR